MLKTLIRLIQLLSYDLWAWVLGSPSAEAARYLKILKAGKSVKSSIKNPYILKLYPGASISLPEGDYVLIFEGDLIKQYGSVAEYLLSIQDYFSLGHVKKADPVYVWFYDKNDLFNFMQITVSDARDEVPITEENIDVTRLEMRQYHQERCRLESYSLELKQLNLNGWSDLSVIEQVQEKDQGSSVISYKISIQDRPYGLVLSTTCDAHKIAKYRKLVQDMARGYVRLPT